MTENYKKNWPFSPTRKVQNFCRFL